MGELLFSGRTGVTAEGSYSADVLVEDEKIVAVAASLDAEGAETVDASGKLVMPGFIDAHTHMDMPFGGTVTADDWATGTEAGGTGADADIVLWDPELSTTATVENRHDNVDYTPYEGRQFHDGPAAVYVRGNLVYGDGEVVGERGSGRFVERSFTATEGLEVRV